MFRVVDVCLVFVVVLFYFSSKTFKTKQKRPLLHLPTPPLAKQQTTMNTHKKTKEEEESLSPKNACSKRAKGNHSFERKRTGSGVGGGGGEEGRDGGTVAESSNLCHDGLISIKYALMPDNSQRHFAHPTVSLVLHNALVAKATLQDCSVL